MDFVVIAADAGQVERISAEKMRERRQGGDTADVWIRYDDVVALVNEATQDHVDRNPQRYIHARKEQE